MVARKRNTAKKPAAKKPAAKRPDVSKEVEFSPDRRITVSVGTALDYGRAKVGISISENIKNGDDPSDHIDSIYDSLAGKLEEKFADLCELVGVEDEPAEEEYEDDAPAEEEYEDDEPADDEPADDELADDGEEDDLTEDVILSMKKAELVELLEEEGLKDINPKLPIKKLREAIIDALFEPEEEDDGEWDDDEWDDD